MATYTMWLQKTTKVINVYKKIKNECILNDLELIKSYSYIIFYLPYSTGS